MSHHIWRKYYYPQNGGGGGGGGGGGDIDLGITGASVGEYAKIKTVDADGVPTAWESGSGGGGGGALIVRATYIEPTTTLDKTWQEIYNAYVAGRPVYLDPLPEEMTLVWGRAYLFSIYHDKEGYVVRFYVPNDGNYSYFAATQTDYPSVDD